MNSAQSNVSVARCVPAYEANSVCARSTDADSHVSHVAHTPQVRLQCIDVIRGICCISMVVFHACFIAQELFGVPLDWFSGVLQQLWRAHIAWSFLFIAGMMCAFTHHMYKRIACYGVTAALIWLVSSSPYVDLPISYGIIFCMCASTILAAILQTCSMRFAHYGWVAVFICAFVLTIHVPEGVLGTSGFTLSLPSQLYTTNSFAFLGFCSHTFQSWDYYPLVPFSFLYLAGYAFAHTRKAGTKPLEKTALEQFCVRLVSTSRIWRAVSNIGKHTLFVYVLHPVCIYAAGSVIRALLIR